MPALTPANSDDTSGGGNNSSGAPTPSGPSSCRPTSRYESQKRRDWNTFGQYLRNHRPPLVLSRCSGAHVLEFLRYLDQFGKTKVHVDGCPFFGHPHPPAPCPCPLRQAWGSLDALVGRLRAAFEENGGRPDTNPFGARAVRLYLREIRDAQSKARGVAYVKKKKRNRPPPKPMPPPASMSLPLAVQSPPPQSMAAAVMPVFHQVAGWNYPHHQLQQQHHFLVDHGSGFMLSSAESAIEGGGQVGGALSSAVAEPQATGGFMPLSVFN